MTNCEVVLATQSQKGELQYIQSSHKTISKTIILNRWNSKRCIQIVVSYMKSYIISHNNRNELRCHFHL